ncbi:MAG: S8 family serine peptidase [Gemmatimonadota bacterium]
MPPRKRSGTKRAAKTGAASRAQGTTADNGIEAMLLAALAAGDDTLETGRYLISYKEGALDAGKRRLASQGMRTADARDFAAQDVNVADVGDADAVVFPEIGVALVTGEAARSRKMLATAESSDDEPEQVIEPEYFVFSTADAGEYLRGFMRAAATIAADIGAGDGIPDDEIQPEVFGATWGLIACRVPPSVRNGLGIRVAVLDTGMDLGHPDFVGRVAAAASFVGQPVQDMHGHGTHCIGTACGPQAPPNATPRYGVAYRSQIFVGKVLTNSGSGSTASVLAGMNWAIANRCAVISMSLGSQAPVQAAYTNAGTAALNAGCLIVAAAGNAGSQTGAPANSPSIFSVASLDRNLTPSSFSNFGKVEIAAPGRDIFSAAPRPRRYATMSGTSMATPHVAGVAALWAQVNPAFRGRTLWSRLRASARVLPLPVARVGAGLVQAP